MRSTLQCVAAAQATRRVSRPAEKKARTTARGGQQRTRASLPRKHSQRLAGAAAPPVVALEEVDVDVRQERRVWEEDDLIQRAKQNQTGEKGHKLKAQVGVRSRPSPLPTFEQLLDKSALSHGTRVFYTQRKGKRFYGDLLQEDDGAIRYSAGQKPDLDLVFPSPTAFNNFCGRLADKNYFKGNGFNYVFHKAPQEKHWMPLDYYRFDACLLVACTAESGQVSRTEWTQPGG